MNTIKTLILALLLVSTFDAFSQEDSIASCCHECCCLEDPTPAGVMISHIHEKGQWMFSYRYMNMAMKNTLVGNNIVSDDYVYNSYLMSSDFMTMHMHMGMAMYGISNRLTAMGMFHYNQTSMEMKMIETTAHAHHSSDHGDMNMKTSGFSDIKLHLLYGLINLKKHHMLTSLGVSAPVGNINIRGEAESMYPQQRLPYVMQLGSGTWDFIPTINYLHKKSNLTLSTQASAILRSGYNNVGYKWGNEYSLTIWGAFKWSKLFDSSLRLEGISSGQLKGMDNTLYAGYEPAANPLNYGGEKMNGFIGTNFHFPKGFLNGNRISIEYGIPIYQNLYGPQMGIKSYLFASWNLTL